MSDFNAEWTELDVCQALNVTPRELKRYVMERIVSPPRTTITGHIYTQEQVDRLFQHLGLQDMQQRIQQVRRRWELDPNDIAVQALLLQLLSLRRLFCENNPQGLRELWEYDSLASETVYLLLDQIRKCRIEDDLFSEAIVLLYVKVVSQKHKR